jgi:hypothetical protein
MHRRKIPRAPKPNTGKAFSPNYITPGVSFAAALQSKAEQTQQSHPGKARLQLQQLQLQPPWTSQEFRHRKNGKKQISQYRLQL